MQSQFRSPEVAAPVNLRRLPGGLHSVAKQASFNVAFRSDFGVFWSDFGIFLEAKMEAQIVFFWFFFRCFFRMRFGIDFGSFFSCFFKSRPSKFMRPRSVLLTFTLFRLFWKTCEKSSILESFSEAKTMKNREKMVLKNVYFFNFVFFGFFHDFFEFWLDFGSPRAFKKLKKNRTKSKKSEKSRFLDGLCSEGGFWKGFGRVLWEFGESLGRILGRFWERFGRVEGSFLKLFGWIWGDEH